MKILIQTIMLKRLMQAFKFKKTAKQEYKDLLSSYDFFTVGTIRDDLEKNKINVQQTLYLLESLGYCPVLLSDDNGHWAVVYEGYQTIPSSKEPEDIESTVIVRKHQWKKTIEEAVLYSLKDEY